MENLSRLKKQQTSKTRGPAKPLLAGGKLVRVHMNLYPMHVDMQEELAKKYNISVSKLHQRMLEREYKRQDLGKIRDRVLQKPLYRSHPGVDRADSEK